MDSLAGTLLTSKVKGLTKDIGNVVGLNEEDNNDEANLEHAKQEDDRKRERAIDERRHERESRHQDKESERDKIRAKYQIPPKGSTVSEPSSSKVSGEQEKKCIIS